MQFQRDYGPEGPKYPNTMYFCTGVVMMVLGRYLVFGYLDPYPGAPNSPKQSGHVCIV